MKQDASEGPSLTGTLANFAADLSISDLPDAVCERVKEYLLDSFAAAIEGCTDVESERVAAVARESMGDGASTVFGAGTMSPAGATLVNGYLITAASLCDIHYPSSCHVTPEVVPPAFVEAERRDARGCDLVVAVAAGLELTTRIGLGLNYPSFHQRGWHTPGVTGVLGAAASGGTLMRLTGAQLAHALGIAASQAGGGHAQHGTPTIKFHQARAALGGLLAARLAAIGFTAQPDVLTDPAGGVYSLFSDGGRPKAALEGLGSRWELMELSLRPWPLSTLMLNVVGTVIELAERESIHGAAVDSMQIIVSSPAYQAHGTVLPSTPGEARRSAAYLGALALHERTVRADQLDPQRDVDPALSDFAQRVEVVENRDYTVRAVRVEVRLASGLVRSLYRQVPRGESTDPLDRNDIMAKFRAAAADRLSAEGIDAVIANTLNLDKEPSVRSLAEALRG